jgi:16S rRNA processing protein RimM
MPRPDWIEVGRVKRAHGIRGEVRVSPSTDNPERFAPGSVLYTLPPGGGERRPLEVEEVRGTWDSMIVAFVDVATREDAEGLRGCVLEVEAAALPDLEDEAYYPFDLEGLEVRSSADGHRVGHVEEVLESPAHELLAVRLAPEEHAGAEAAGSAAEVLVPFTFEAVPEVHVRAGYVVVRDRFLRGPEDVPLSTSAEDAEPAG